MRSSRNPMDTGGRRIPEAMLVEIIARLPLKSIARFKLLCKNLKSLIDSKYFRSLFVSVHQNSSSSWSLIFAEKYCYFITEAIGFHGCKTWGLPKSLASYIMPFKLSSNLRISSYSYVASSNGLIWIDVRVYNTYRYKLRRRCKSLVGNPVLQQWVEIPLSPCPYQDLDTGLVTRVENGTIISFKVIKTCHMGEEQDSDTGMYVWRVYVYSSETGLWTLKRLFSSHPIDVKHTPLNLNGMLYMWTKDSDPSEPGVLIAHDFYAPKPNDDDQCRVIPLPVPYNKNVRRCLTSSRGDIIYIEILYPTLKVWRLSNKECWQLLTQGINMVSVGIDVKCFPMAMNPFDSDIVCLWSQKHSCLVSGNLKTKEFIVHQELENWSSTDNTCESKRNIGSRGNVTSVFMLSLIVLPPWMDSIPRPPK